MRGTQYPTVVRWKDIPESSEEELVLDVGALAAGHRGQYNLGSWTVSSDNRRVAFTADFNGDGQFRVFMRTLSTGNADDQSIEGAASSLVFGADSKSLLYFAMTQ